MKKGSLSQSEQVPVRDKQIVFIISLTAWRGTVNELDARLEAREFWWLETPQILVGSASYALQKIGDSSPRPFGKNAGADQQTAWARGAGRPESAGKPHNLTFKLLLAGFDAISPHEDGQRFHLMTEQCGDVCHGGLPGNHR